MGNMLGYGEECWIVEGRQGFFLAVKVCYILGD